MAAAAPVPFGGDPDGDGCIMANLPVTGVRPFPKGLRFVVGSPMRTAEQFASGTGHSFHCDFFSAWDDATLDALVDHCVIGGLQCDARGYDQANTDRGAALDANYELP